MIPAGSIRWLVAAVITNAWPHFAGAVDVQQGLAVFARPVPVRPSEPPYVPKEIFLVTPNGLTIQLTHDGLQKRLPVISPDGTKIAYDCPEVKRAASKLVIIDLNGKVLDEALIQPQVDNVGYLGRMSPVDQLQWIDSGTKVAVRGWINPSSAQYYLIKFHASASEPSVASARQIPQGDVYADFVDDNSKYARYPAAAFSAGGLHFAYVFGLPHFTGANPGDPPQPYDGRPVIAVDYQPTSMGSQPYRVVSPIRWAPSGNAMAVLIQDAASQRVTLVTAQVPNSSPDDGKANFRSPLQFRKALVPVRFAAAPLRIMWAQNTVYVTQQVAGQAALRHAWLYRPGSSSVESVSPEVADTVDPARAEQARQRRFATQALAKNGVSSDAVSFWFPGAAEPQEFPRDWDDAAPYMSQE